MAWAPCVGAAVRGGCRCSDAVSWYARYRQPVYRKTGISLRCSYDSVADAAYIYFDHPISAGGVHRTVPFDPADVGMVNLDVDDAGRLLGLEVLGAKNRLPAAMLRGLTE